MSIESDVWFPKNVASVEEFGGTPVMPLFQGQKQGAIKKKQGGGVRGIKQVYIRRDEMKLIPAEKLHDYSSRSAEKKRQINPRLWFR